MWRRTERASLEKKPSIRLSQEPLRWGVKTEGEAALGLVGEPALGFPLDMVRAMIVEDQP